MKWERYRKGIVDLNAEVSDGTFDHCVAEQKLHGASSQAELDRGAFLAEGLRLEGQRRQSHQVRSYAAMSGFSAS